MSLASNLNVLCNLQVKTTQKGASGGAVPSWATLTADVPGDLQPASSNVQNQYTSRMEMVSHSLFTETDIAARPEHRVTIGSRTFRVVGYTPPAPGYDEWPARTDLVEEFN